MSFLMGEKKWWERKRNEDFTSYCRRVGSRQLEIQIIPGWSYQAVIALQEKVAGVPYYHPEYAERLKKAEEKFCKKVSSIENSI